MYVGKTKGRPGFLLARQSICVQTTHCSDEPALFPNPRLHRPSQAASPEASNCSSRGIVYFASSQIPRSISLHRWEQNGKNRPASHSFRDGLSTGLSQAGHLRFMARFCQEACSSCSVISPCSIMRAYSTQYLAHGLALSRALLIALLVPSQMP